MSDKKFEIVNGLVVRVFEFEHGQWQQEYPEPGESYHVSGDSIIKTENEHGQQEIEVYLKTPGSDTYYQTHESSSQGHDGLDQDHSDDHDHKVTSDGHDNEHESYPFDTRVDGVYTVGDDEYHVINGQVFERETDGYYQTTDQQLEHEGQSHTIEHRYSSPDEETPQGINIRQEDGSHREVESPEHALAEDQSLARLYKAVFDRMPDTDGFQYWSERLDTGLNFDDVVENFLVSPEFTNTYSELDNSQFLDTLYNNVLNRDADSEGHQYWSGQLESNTLSRAQIVQNFSESSEFKDLSAADVGHFIETAGQSSLTTDMIMS